MHFCIQLLITIGFLGGLMWTIMKFAFRDIHKELKDIRKDIYALKLSMEKTDARHEKSEARTDHLYEICIEMLKTRYKG